MFDVYLIMILLGIVFLVAVFVWAYKDKQYVEREIEWSKHDQQIAIVLGELVERHYNVMECIDNKIEFADKLRTPLKELDYGDDLGYWNGVYKELKALKEEIDEKNDKFHVKIEKITKEM